ncbi:hypothetical protein DICPUDRAFT_95204 [Dictyostelium purpureum]|uniref:Uncharacterized protein n=1 Tax=Dictyostelium purpureum TaxID=5786 RepID=F0ZTJ0_DICPU|nr:uncharacterized protein DICPUDRAFT_95204 [Dictyostelium purpureum]EGC32735.1 hypothetical protein DICPUDRAFT_95204 [Dictyostelium purpureum]|eukprot:XP_003290733.1 hypothetical protein DICPUDRAFT_95204 [Dictyostelium purpureum]
MEKEILNFLNEGIQSKDNIFILSNVNKTSKLEEMVSGQLLRKCSKWSVSDFKKGVEQFISEKSLNANQIISTVNSVTIFMISKKLQINEMEEWTKNKNYVLRAFSTCFFIKYYFESEQKFTDLYETLVTLETFDLVKFYSIQTISSLDIIGNYKNEIFEILVNYLDLYKDLDNGDGEIAIKTIKVFLSRVGLIIGQDEKGFIDQAHDKTPFDLLMKVSSVDMISKTTQNMACIISLSLSIFNGNQSLCDERKQLLSNHLVKNLTYYLPVLCQRGLTEKGCYFMSICRFLTEADQTEYYKQNIEVIRKMAKESYDRNKFDFLFRENKVLSLYLQDFSDDVIEFLNHYIQSCDKEEVSTDFLKLFHSVLRNGSSNEWVNKYYPVLLEYINLFEPNEDFFTLDETPELFYIYTSIDKEERSRVTRLLDIHETAISNEILVCLDSGDLDDILEPMEYYLQLMQECPEECKTIYMNTIMNHLSSYYVILFEDFEGGEGGFYNEYKDEDKETIDKLFDNFLKLKSQTCTTKESKRQFFKDFVTQESKYCPLFKLYFEL